MDLVIPKILTGSQTGTGQQIKTAGREIARTGVAISAVIDNIQKNIDYNNAVGIKNESELEKQKYSEAFWMKEDGSRPDSVQKFQEGLTEIDRRYSERAYKFGDRVGGFVDKYNQVRTAELTQSGQKVYYKKMFDKSQQMDLAETDLMTKSAINSGEINFAMQERDKALESRRSIYGDNVDGMKVAHRALMAENFIKGRLANPATASAMIQAMNDPTYKANLFQYIPAGKVDEIEKLITTAREKQDGTDAFLKTMNEANELPDVKSGKVSQMDAAQQIWMSPTTITKYGLTDKTWREGMLNFEHSIKFRDAQDEKAAGNATLDLSERYNRHSLRYDDIEKAFGDIQNPKLKGQFVEHWTKLIDAQAAQIRAEKTAARGAAAAERSARAAELANNRFNVDNPEVKARLLQRSIETPFSPGLVNEVNLALGDGISSNTYKVIMGNIKGSSVWKTPAGKELYRILNQDRKDYQYSTNEKENAERYGEMLEHYKEYLEKYPNATPKEVLSDYETKKKEMRKGAIRKLIETKYDQVMQ